MNARKAALIALDAIGDCISGDLTADNTSYSGRVASLLAEDAIRNILRDKNNIKEKGWQESRQTRKQHAVSSLQHLRMFSQS